MIVKVEALMQQQWRAAKLFEAMYRYAKSIGCTMFQDEIICHNDAQARKLANWWMEHTL